MSRNNSVSTTETASTYPSTRLNTTLSATSTARTSIFSSTSDKENRVISDFNPTLVLYIPPHGLGLAARGKKMSADLTIHDVTTYLPGFNHNTLTIPDTVQTKDIKNVVASRKWDATPPALISKRSSKFSSRSTIVLPQNDEYPDVAEFHVPWDVMKPSTITLQDLKENDEMEVWCGKEDRRAQLWRMGREMYVWRWTKAGDLVLEKESQEMGSHQIGAFLFKVSLDAVFMSPDL